MRIKRVKVARLDKFKDGFEPVTGVAVDVNVDVEQYHSYAVIVEPEVNFELTGLTRITRDDGELFVFQGFSILSHTTLDHLPQCKFERFGGIYSIRLHKHPTMKNFTMKDALIYQEFLFVKLLELYEWIECVRPFSTELLFVPRFVRKLKDSECEVLSLAEVLHHLHAGMTSPTSDISTKTPGFLVFSPNKAPSCYRVDEISCRPSKSHCQEDVRLGHWCAQLLTKTKAETVQQYKAQRQRYSELNNKRFVKKLSRNEHFELRDLKDLLAQGNHSKHQPEDAGMVWLSSSREDGLLVTGLYYDVVQHATVLPIISHHVLVYDSLTCLEEKIGYKFRDLQLLLRAVTHPSCTTYTYNVAEDNVKNALSNGGLKWYERQETMQPPKKMKALLAELEKGDATADEGQRLQNNEQLEYLGDALLEYMCSIYLYLKYPQIPVGQLVSKRQDLVKNHFLRKLAEKLDIRDYVLHNKKAQLLQSSFLHFSGNCIESILGAVYLDGGAGEAKKLFGCLAFSGTESEYENWMYPGKDPVQSEYSDGDRHLISDSDFLKSMLRLEEKCGVTFHHISLLGRAFTHSSCHDTELTMGNYQRLEFLGDAVLQFLVSKYIYFRLPAYNEGHLSMVRTALVHNKQLATLCQELGFLEFLQTSESKKEEVVISVKIMADVFESYLGALTLDQGLEAAEKFLRVHLFPKLSDVVKASQLVDSTTRLHQAAVYTCKQQGIKVELPVYKKLPVEGTSSNPIYTVTIHYGKREVARGTSGMLKEARRIASENALKSGIFRIPPSQKMKSEQSPERTVA